MQAKKGLGGWRKNYEIAWGHPERWLPVSFKTPSFIIFSKHGSRINNYTTEFRQWWSKPDGFAGETKAEKAKAWLISKGVTAEQVEHIREIFVEGYTAQTDSSESENESKNWTKCY